MKDYVTDVKPINVKHVTIIHKKSKPIARNFPDSGLFNLAESELHQMSKKNYRKFVAERTIDLHGLTRDEAFEKLLSFFSRCQLENVKKVIVITGGNALKKTVLRASFQEWVKNLFGNYIVSCSQSDIRHGGQGAFYVILKNVS
jgi:DNA-nicking Smr family endonuclease